MQFRILISLSHFKQVLNSIRKHYTKNKHFPKHIPFSTLYSLQELKLNPRNYSEHELNMINFVNAIEHYVHMYAKFGGLPFYEFFVIKYSKN
jgi:hypothetical protein